MSLWLAKNQRSNEVAALQYALWGAPNQNHKPQPDGDFGQHTEAAVREFQSRRGLMPDGIAGPRTLHHLFEKADVTVNIRAFRINSERVGAGPGSPAPPGAPGRLPHPSPQAPDTGVLDFTNFGWFTHESAVLRYLLQKAPKPPLDEPPHPSVIRHPPAPDAGLPRFTIEPIVLTPAHRFAARKHPTAFRTLFSLEVETKGTFTLPKALGMEFKTSIILSKFDPWLVPRASVFTTFRGEWGLSADLSISAEGFRWPEWGKTSVVGNPIELRLWPALVGTMAWPHLVGYRPELKLTGGWNAGLSWQVGHSAVRCGFGVGAAWLVFRPEEVEGGIRPLPLTGMFSGNFTCELGAEKGD